MQNFKTDAELNDFNPNNLNDTKIAIQINNINIQLQQRLTKQCRICLSSDESSSNKLISPCECSGSLKFVHPNCLRSWLEIKASQNADYYYSKNVVNCQLCNQAIKVKFQMFRECKKAAKIWQQIIETPVLFVICIIGIGVSFAVLIYSILTLNNQIQEGYENIDTISKSIVLVSIPIQLLLFLYFVVMILRYFVARRAKLELEDY